MLVPGPKHYESLALYRAPLTAWAVLISLSSGVPVHSIEAARMTFEVQLVPDSYAFVAEEFRYHVGAFGVLALLTYRALRTTMGSSRGRAFRVVALLAIGYALVDELHQAFVPGRVASLIDLGYDVLGAAIFLVGVAASTMVNGLLSGIGGARHG